MGGVACGARVILLVYACLTLIRTADAKFSRCISVWVWCCWAIRRACKCWGVEICCYIQSGINRINKINTYPVCVHKYAELKTLYAWWLHVAHSEICETWCVEVPINGLLIFGEIETRHAPKLSMLRGKGHTSTPSSRISRTYSMTCWCRMRTLYNSHCCPTYPQIIPNIGNISRDKTESNISNNIFITCRKDDRIMGFIKSHCVVQM